MISVAGPDEAERLAALHGECFDRPWSAADLAALLAQRGALGLAGPDGFILVQRVLDEAEVLTLAVRPAAQRRGAGRALLAAAAQALAALGVAELRLEVAEDNAAAAALYAGEGFAVVGRRRGYYARPSGRAVDAVLMRRRLTAAPPAPILAP